MPGTDVLLTRRQVLLLRTETNYGADADPTETQSFDAMKLIDPFTLDTTQEFVEITGGNLTRGMAQPIGTVRPIGVTFRSYMVGIAATESYSATQKAPLADALRACGLFETFTASNADGEAEYRYDPGANVGSDTSVTIVVNQDGMEWW